MFTRKPPAPAKTRHIKFVGKTPRRRDNLFRSGLVWMPGEVHVVTDEMAAEFTKYPDVWAEVDENGGILVDQYLSACAKAKLPPLLVDEAPAPKDVDAGQKGNGTEGQDEQNPGQGSDDEKQGDDKAPDPAADADPIAAIKQAIYSLDRNNQDHFTEKGSPKVAAVREIAGEDVTVAMLNQAWKEIDG